MYSIILTKTRDNKSCRGVACYARPIHIEIFERIVIQLRYPEKNKRPLKKDVNTRTKFETKAEEAIRQFRSSNTPFDPADDNGINRAK